MRPVLLKKDDKFSPTFHNNILFKDWGSKC